MTAPCGVNGHGLKIPVALRGRQDRAGPWLGSSHRVPGLGTGIRAQPVPFCPHREGAGVSSHPAQTPQGEEAESWSPQRPVWSVLCLSTYFSHLSSSPLFPAQFEAELLATKPSQCQQTTGDPMGQPWRWRLAVSWPWHREAGPQSGCLHGCAWPQISHRKAKKHSPVFLPAPMSPARLPHSVGPLSLLDGAVM